MLIGDRGGFAVEFVIDDTKTHWIFGKFCYWADHQMIGEYDAGAALGVGTSGVEWVASTRGKKFEERLFQADANVAFASIYNPIFGGPAEGLIEIERSDERLGLFYATPGNFDIFDKYMGFLIESAAADRFLWKRLDESGAGRVHECYLDHGSFFDVLDQYVEYMRENTCYGEFAP